VNKNRQPKESESEDDNLDSIRVLLSKFQSVMERMNKAENMDESELEELEDMSSALQSIQSQFSQLLSKEESDQ
jgi:hypothetical protein